jgi:vacuolar-type H+-ATPase subunit I/STV1
MAFKITKTDDKRIREALEKLAAARSKLEDEVFVFNDAQAKARDALQVHIDAHDEAAQEVRGLIEDIHREADEEFDGKSEKWQESDKGEAAREWIDSVEALVGEIEDADANQLPGGIEADSLLPSDPVDEYDALDKEPQ